MSNLPLSGGKCCHLDGGTRIPLIIRYPDVAKAGVECDELVHLVDLFPTFLEYTGAARREGQILDGMSLRPVIEQRGTLGDRAVFLHFPRKLTTSKIAGASNMHKGTFKLTRMYGGSEDQMSDRYFLYDFRNDPGEQNDLAEKLPEKVEELKAELNAWLEEVGALIPKPNPSYKG